MMHTVVSLLSAGIYLAAAEAPPTCDKNVPGPGKGKCTIPKPKDDQFAPICQPGAMGHAGGAEVPTNRCPLVNYTEGVFTCSCCGQPLFYAKSKYDAQTGWPAFHSPPVFDKKANTSNVCNPAGQDTEVVCSTCGAHLGDYFTDDDHFCIDGVCLHPPGSKEACPPGPNQ